MSNLPPYFQLPKETSWDAWTAVLRRSAIDPEYRERLLADPHAAVAEELGEVPEGYVVQFVEKPAGVNHVIVLPNLIEDAAELTEEELEAVAGGAGDCSCSVSNCTGSCVAELPDPGTGGVS